MEKTILSTKLLQQHLQERILSAGLGVVHYDALKIVQLEPEMSLAGKHLIVTSKNAIPALGKLTDGLAEIKIFCVGSVTASLLEKKDFDIQFQAEYSNELASHLIDHYADQEFTFLTSAQRRDEIPDMLTAQDISFKELHIYNSQPVIRRFERTFAAVLFYSPRGVYAFAKANPQQTTAICIGKTTATAAREFYGDVVVASRTTVQNTVITAIKTLRNEK